MTLTSQISLFFSSSPHTQTLPKSKRSEAMAFVIDSLMNGSPVVYVNGLLDVIGVHPAAPTKSDEDEPAAQLQMLLLTQLVEESL
jgi:hypothetical protein